MNDKDRQTKWNEATRLLFILNRDGLEAMIDFCRRGKRSYLAAARARHGRGLAAGYGRTYRRSLVISCLLYRAIIQTHEGVQHVQPI